MSLKSIIPKEFARESPHAKQFSFLYKAEKNLVKNIRRVLAKLFSATVYYMNALCDKLPVLINMNVYLVFRY